VAGHGGVVSLRLCKSQWDDVCEEGCVVNVDTCTSKSQHLSIFQYCSRYIDCTLP